jgi:hypothetical protein
MNAEISHADVFSLARDAWGQLTLSFSDGRQFENVDVSRAFPISAPGEYVSICEAGGREIVCIEDPAKLPTDVWRTIEDELSRREFVPVVLRIEQVLADVTPVQWRIVTDRGPVEFLMEDSDDDVRRLGPNRILLVDTHGIRYLISDTRTLDATSRRILDRYL